MTKEQAMYFDQCMEFLARMIEKYGDRVCFPDPLIQEGSSDTKLNTNREHIAG